MKSFTTLRNLYGSFTKDTSSANLTLCDQLINDSIRSIFAMKAWPFLHLTRTLTTAASTQFYNLPYDTDMVESVFVTVSSTRYTPRPVASREEWDMLNETSYTSDFPERWIVYNGQLGLWPTPTSASNTITVNCKVGHRDLSIADYTTGSIVSVAVGGTAVVGTGTTWTIPMGGRWLRITASDTANTGDGLWYEISSVTDTTNLTLVRGYGGTAIAAGTAAYTLGQMSRLPENFQQIPAYEAASVYWAKEDQDRFKYYSDQAVEMRKALAVAYSSPDSDPVLDEGYPEEIINPNLIISF